MSAPETPRAELVDQIEQRDAAISRLKAALRDLCGWPKPDPAMDTQSLIDAVFSRRLADGAKVLALRDKVAIAEKALGQIETMTARLEGVTDRSRLLDFAEVEQVYRLAGDAIVALRDSAPVVPATEDPAPHVHTEACMCDMVPMEVVGGYECHHCGGHDGGPCGSLCEVAYDEITATPAPQPRVWLEGDLIPADVDTVTGKRTGKTYQRRTTSAYVRASTWTTGLGWMTETTMLGTELRVAEALSEAPSGSGA